MKRAITHKGYALVDIFQPCVTFNKLNTYQWFKENVYYLDDSHDSSDRAAAFAKATEEDKLPLGVFYVNPKSSFEENTEVYQDDRRPLAERDVDKDKLAALVDSLKMTG
jgi:2-oxoglutarate ferredoxin oxidoreductase subunit beta